MTTIKTIGLVVLGVIVSVLFSVSMNGGGDLAGVYDQVLKYFPQGIQVGAGTDIAKVQTGVTGTCTGAATVAASSQATYNCAVTGVASGDKVFVTLPNATPANIFLANAYASTTAADYIQVELGNASSTASVAVTGATSSIQYLTTR